MNDMSDKVTGADEFAGLVTAARDSMNDDMVARLAESASQALDLLDRVNRSGVAEALPAIAEMVKTGDLERLTRYARMMGAAEDAVTDDMIGRFATLAGEATMVVDALHRSGVMKLIQLLDQLNTSGALDRIATKLPALVDNLELVENMFACMSEASKEVKQAPAPSGGFFAVMAMMRDPENQKALQFFMAMGKRMREKCTK